MRYLLSADAAGVSLCPEPDRDLVTRDDALKAVNAIAAFINTAEGIDPEDTYFAAAFLMVIREYIKPLPNITPTAGGPSHVTPDLQPPVDYLRSLAPQREQTHVQRAASLNPRSSSQVQQRHSLKEVRVPCLTT